MVFMGYIMVERHQLGATVDYSILLTNSVCPAEESLEEEGSVYSGALMLSCPSILLREPLSRRIYNKIFPSGPPEPPRRHPCVPSTGSMLLNMLITFSLGSVIRKFHLSVEAHPRFTPRNLIHPAVIVQVHIHGFHPRPQRRLYSVYRRGYCQCRCKA